MSGPSRFHIVPAHDSASLLDEVRTLFAAYTDWLGFDLGFQNYAAELASLPGLYQPPDGALLLALDDADESVLGVIALRPLVLAESQTSVLGAEFRGPGWRYCELKRLYTVPAARGRGVAKALVREALGRAERAGHRVALLDTLSKMEAALGLYRSMGFVETGKYYGNPMDDVCYMAKRLKPGEA